MDRAALKSFLAKFAPDGPWHLSAARVDDSGGFVSRTFDNLDEAASWAEVLNTEVNPHQIYHHINPVRTRDKKAKDADVEEVRWLQVDIDPRKGETAAEAADRIGTLLFKKYPKHVKPPTIVVFSGGGYQLYWKLKKPIPLDGTDSMAKEAAGYSKALAALFDGGDGCFDVSRIFRTPGTVNWPSKKKRARGQEQQLAKVVEWHGDRLYDESDFVRARPVQDDSAGSCSVSIPDVVPDVGLQELADCSVPGKCLDIITNGPGPEHPSRSEAVFYVCCELVRCKVPDEKIYAVLTCADFEISESILQNTNPRRYAVRQIERAHEHAISPALAEMNAKYSVVTSHAGKFFVMHERFNPLFKRPEIVLQSKQHFLDATANLEPVIIGQSTISRSRFWLGHSMRKQYDDIVFAPGQELPQSLYNLFHGFAYEAGRGNGSCDLFLEHVRDNVCKGNATHYEYLVNWMARAVQFPGEPAATAIVLQGEPGTGKSFFANHFGALFGRHFLPIADPKHLLGSFNAHLVDCILLFADEAFSCSDAGSIARLKGRITERYMTVEKKGVDAVLSTNCLHIIMASNEQWVVPMSVGDRRFFVLEVGTGHRKDNSYFAAVERQLAEKDGAGYAALLMYLLQRDLSQFNVTVIPFSEAANRQKIHTMSSEESWWYDVLSSGLICGAEPWEKWTPTSWIQHDYCSHCDQYGGRNDQKAIETLLGIFMRHMVPGLVKRRRYLSYEAYEYDGTRATRECDNWYRFPPVSECREAFDRLCEGPYEWPSLEVVAEKEEECPL